MARAFKNFITSSSLWAVEVTDRLKALEDLVSLLGGAIYIFDNNNTEADPGSGRFRLDDSTKADATVMYISEFTLGNINIEDFIEDVVAGDAIIIRQEDDISRNLHATVTGTITDNTTWFKIEFTVDVANGSEFQNNRACSISIVG
jgi:hypothetical protein